MSQTLYRKYRSQRFADLVGQQSVTRILQNSIMRGRLAHAYLFCGPRGTGKTSVARIFAKALNCENPQGGDACGVCEVCVSIAEGRSVDVVEIDAASNRGIDDVRELRERVNYAPLALAHKVYIIDEVHMITPQGFNALLKTLEEPPGFVVFCLCTTEAHKLPLTILSRCIRFDFQRLPLKALAEHLVSIAQLEGFALDSEASEELSRLAEGSARDAISLLDQLLVYCNQNISVSAVHELFQLGDPHLVDSTLKLLEAGDTPALLDRGEEVVALGVEISRFMLQLADAIKQRYLETSDLRWSRALHALWQGLNLLKEESYPALLLQLTLISTQQALTQAMPATSASAVNTSASQAPARTSRPPERASAPPPPTSKPPASPVQTAGPDVAAAAPAMQSKEQPPAAGRNPVPSVQADSPALPDLAAEPWERYLALLREQRITAYALIYQHVDAELKDGMLRMTFALNAIQPYRFAQKEENAKHLLEIARTLFGPKVQVELLVEDTNERTLLGAAEQASPQQELPPLEVVSDVVDEPEVNAPSEAEFDPAKLSEDADTVNAQLELTQNPVKLHPSTEDILTLFEAEEIEPDEHS